MPRGLARALVGIMALTIAACGDGDSDVGTGSTTVPSSSSVVSGPTSTSGAAASSGDRARAEGLLLQQADAPAGFTASPHEATSTEDEAGRKLAACAGLPEPSVVNELDVHGPDLVMGEFTRATSQVTVVKTAETAKAEAQAINAPKFRTCLRDHLTQSIREQLGDTAVTEATAEPLPVKSFGEATVGTRVAMKLEVAGQSVSSFQDSVLLVKGRFEATLTFLSFEKPFDAATRDALLAKVGARVEALT